MKLGKIPLRILVALIIAGSVGIAGEIILKYNIDSLSEKYRLIVDEYFINQQYMYEIKALMYQDQTVVLKHVLSDDESVYEYYENRNNEITSELWTILKDFGLRIQDSDMEVLYHRVYSDAKSYINNAGSAIDLSRVGMKSTAAYYCNNIMNDFLVKVDEDVDALSEIINNDLEAAREKMDFRIMVSQYSEIICIIAIIAATVFGMVYCVGITYNLDKYKDNLEKEIEDKNRALNEHHEKMIALQDNTIIGMANLIENRDGDTGGHVKRTSNYVNMLAKAAKGKGYCADILTDEYIEMLTKAAPMHDIGKISVPDSILKKPGKLTPQEFECIKNHAFEGGRIVSEVLDGIEEKEYVEIAKEVASGHHEKWDGSGYPFGLKGDEIPISARIMAIADVFDALVSKRCYKEAMTFPEAIKEIKRCAGTHFDPVLANLFVEIQDEVRLTT